MSENPRIELILFDLGGVLIRLADNRAHAADLAGIDLPTLDDEAMAAWMDCRNAHEVGEVDCAGFLKRITAISGLSDDDHRNLYRTWLQGPFPGVAELIDDLLDSSCALGCLSNTNDFHWAMMNASDGDNALPLNRLHHRFASHLVGHRKPNEGIYAHVEQAIGINPKRILFFDDLAENIAAANERGWYTKQITDPSDPVAQMRSVLKSVRVFVD